MNNSVEKRENRVAYCNTSYIFVFKQTKQIQPKLQF